MSPTPSPYTPSLPHTYKIIDHSRRPSLHSIHTQRLQRHRALHHHSLGPRHGNSESTHFDCVFGFRYLVDPVGVVEMGEIGEGEDGEEV